MSKLTTYWDFTRPERAKLTDEQIKYYCEVELMSQGIPLPDMLPLYEIPEEPKLPTKTYYRIGDFYFDKIEDAQKLMDLRPCTYDYIGQVGYDKKFPKPYTGSIETVEMYNKFDLENAVQLLSEIRQKKTDNDKRQSENKKAQSKIEQATENIHKDLSECRDLVYQLDTMKRQYAKYLQMCNDDEVIAVRFFKNAYTVTDRIKEFDPKWFEKFEQEVATELEVAQS